MATKVYLCSMELPGGTVPDIALLSEGLSEERREKINSRRFEKDKIQALGAGLLLDHGLREYGLRAYPQNNPADLPGTSAGLLCICHLRYQSTSA